ncbi:type II toxin-antitoxin system RelB/DinJ family antitoxin [Luteolibacter sp. Populi]|uniref:type II toxin-antitoxin system RelB/DinJ family antitoxin n=1 Tax=Luteolibacter sp. Populi TaxID=3230487 RepID=UPI003465C8BC
MAQSAVIHARIDSATKAETERILETIGLSPTEAIRLLYRQIAIRGEFPLELKVPNATTAAALTEAEQGDGLESFETLEDLYASWDE